MDASKRKPHGNAKLTPEVQQKIVQAIRAGNYVTVAVDYAGIDRSTFYRWMERGRQQRTGMYHDFHQAVRQAESFAEVRAVAILQSEMKENWRAALSYLERKFPDRWATGAQQHKHVQASDSEPNHERTLDERIAHYESVFDRLSGGASHNSPNAAAETGGDSRGDGPG